jgi:hypothetical protein
VPECEPVVVATITQTVGVPRSVCEDEQNRRAGNHVCERGQRLLGLLIDPVEVFDDEDERLRAAFLRE